MTVMQLSHFLHLKMKKEEIIMYFSQQLCLFVYRYLVFIFQMEYLEFAEQQEMLACHIQIIYFASP